VSLSSIVPSCAESRQLSKSRASKHGLSHILFNKLRLDTGLPFSKRSLIRNNTSDDGTFELEEVARWEYKVLF